MAGAVEAEGETTASRGYDLKNGVVDVQDGAESSVSQIIGTKGGLGSSGEAGKLGFVGQFSKGWHDFNSVKIGGFYINVSKNLLINRKEQKKVEKGF